MPDDQAMPVTDHLSSQHREQNTPWSSSLTCVLVTPHYGGTCESTTFSISCHLGINHLCSTRGIRRVEGSHQGQFQIYDLWGCLVRTATIFPLVTPIYLRIWQVYRALLSLLRSLSFVCTYLGKVSWGQWSKQGSWHSTCSGQLHCWWRYVSSSLLSSFTINYPR